MPSRRTVLLPLVLTIGLAACSSGTSSPSNRADGSATTSTSPSQSASPSPTPTPTPEPPPELPRGGRTIFPGNVVVAYYGVPQGSGDLGILGQGTPDEQAAALEEAAAPFAVAAGRPVLPAFELITTVAQTASGTDGDFSEPLAVEQVQTYLDAARRAKMLLILDLQPGRASFLDQAKLFEQFLVEPDVGLALDPEWKLTADQRPLRQIGRTSAAAINEVSAYLQGLVDENDLPQKIMMVHQFKSFSIPDREQVISRPGLATVLHVDGFGSQGAKKDTYDVLAAKGGELINGFKLFLDEDTNLLTPAETMAIVPQPDLVTYQ